MDPQAKRIFNIGYMIYLIALVVLLFAAKPENFYLSFFVLLFLFGVFNIYLFFFMRRKS